MLVSEHAFNKLNLHRICTGMVKGNEASKRAFERQALRLKGC